MSRVSFVVEAIAALFIIAIFAFSFFPALETATGQSMIWAIILLVIMAIGIIIAAIKNFR